MSAASACVKGFERSEEYSDNLGGTAEFFRPMWTEKLFFYAAEGKEEINYEMDIT